MQIRRRTWLWPVSGFFRFFILSLSRKMWKVNSLEATQTDFPKKKREEKRFLSWTSILRPPPLSRFWRLWKLDFGDFFPFEASFGERKEKSSRTWDFIRRCEFYELMRLLTIHFLPAASLLVLLSCWRERTKFLRFCAVCNFCKICSTLGGVF